LVGGDNLTGRCPGISGVVSNLQSTYNILKQWGHIWVETYNNYYYNGKYI